MTDARSLALQVLTHITTDRIELDDALARTGFAHAAPRDRGFAYRLVMASLRYGRAADAVLAAQMDSLLPERKQRARWVMRMGVVELLVLGTPDHAAVSEAVRLMKSHKGDKAYSGVTNAVLKKIALARPAWDALNAFPETLIASWKNAYGAEATQEISASFLHEPSLDITAISGEIRDVLHQTLGGTSFAATSLRLGTEITDVTALDGYAEGTWWVQDIAAAQPVTLLGDIKGCDVLDLCAAPGGKTAQLCAAGARVTAVDRSPARVNRLRENMQRLKMTPNIIEADIARWQPEQGQRYDAILLDAPCSATGTLRRHPDLHWTRDFSDYTRLISSQRTLLERAWEWLKPSGKLVYAVCSLQREEGEEQIEWFIKNWPDAVSESADMLRLLPHSGNAEGEMDGFFAARISKTP
jgi:16S rRNA (cytosine967-C5)-methyltransferase